MRHALAWAEDRHGASAVTQAGKKISWVGKPGAMRPISRGEDIFGVADLLCLRPGRPLLVQVTTQTKSRGTVWTRRKKAQEWLEQVGPDRCSFWVIAWVRGKHFRCWAWFQKPTRPTGEWHELEPFWSPADTRRVRDAT